MELYKPIKSEHIKIQNSLCMQCKHQNCLLLENGSCPYLSDGYPEKKSVVSTNELVIEILKRR